MEYWVKLREYFVKMGTIFFRLLSFHLKKSIQESFKEGNFWKSLSNFVYLKLKFPNQYGQEIIEEVINQPLPILLSTSHGTSHSVVYVSSYGVVQKLRWHDFGLFDNLTYPDNNKIRICIKSCYIIWISIQKFSAC